MHELVVWVKSYSWSENQISAGVEAKFYTGLPI